MSPEILINRFMKKVEKTDTCWNWIGGQRGKGYGAFNPVYKGKIMQAHRFSYETFKGSIPVGLQVDHLCRNRLCVNPSHLEAVSVRENVLRGNGIAGNNSRKTHCKRGHAFSKENTRVGSKDGNLTRTCRKCMSILQKKFQNKRKTFSYKLKFAV